VPGTPEERRVPMKGGIWRYHPDKHIVEVLTHGTTNPWGHDWDANGEMFFINTVTGHLWHLIHGAHLVDTNSPNPLIYEKLDTIADHYHFDRGKAWSESRDGKANHLGGGHAHIGLMIYQADQWPEPWRNKLYTLNMHGRRTNVERIERRGSGYVGRHDSDIFVSGDPWFRGIEISTGPDGSGFLLDWSDTGECHESTGVHRTSGRIYRISFGKPAKPTKPFAWRKPWPKADLASPDEHSRALAVRELVQFSPIDAITGPMADSVYPELALDPVAMAKAESSSFVRLNLASVLQRLPLERRPDLALALLSHEEDAGDPFLPSLLWFGISPLAKTDPQALVGIAAACRWPKVTKWIARSLARQPEALDDLLSVDSSASVLEGMAEAFRGIRKAPKPSHWDSIAENSDSRIVRELSIVFGDGRALEEVKALALDNEADVMDREEALKTLVEARPPDLRVLCEKLLEKRGLTTTAVRGLALFEDPSMGERIAKSYRKFHPQDRPAVLDTLVSRPAFARSLLAVIAAGTVPKADLGAFRARQIREFGDEVLSNQLTQVWGELRESSAEKKALMETLKGALTPAALASANLGKGRALFSAICSSCHTLYDEGGKIGPDLTGSGRANLDYLLENIVDPGAVVSADYRMSFLTLKDGRKVGGVTAGQDEQTLSIRTLTETLTFGRNEIVRTETSPFSMMPEGILSSLPSDQVRDLIAYLMNPVQVPLSGK